MRWLWVVAAGLALACGGGEGSGLFGAKDGGASGGASTTGTGGASSAGALALAQGCDRDTDCKGDRVCVARECVTPDGAGGLPGAGGARSSGGAVTGGTVATGGSAPGTGGTGAGGVTPIGSGGKIESGGAQGSGGSSTGGAASCSVDCNSGSYAPGNYWCDEKNSAGPTCKVCPTGLLDCSDPPGCETHGGNNTNCGYCGEVCGPNERCATSGYTLPYFKCLVL